MTRKDKTRFRCLRCGNCCVNIKVQVSFRDVDAWVKKKRFNVLHHVLLGVLKEGKIFFIPADEYLKKSMSKDDVVLGALGWHNPDEDERVIDCPFLEETREGKNRCNIYGIRPQACRNFPLNSTKKGRNTKAMHCPALNQTRQTKTLHQKTRTPKT